MTFWHHKLNPCGGHSRATNADATENPSTIPTDDSLSCFWNPSLCICYSIRPPSLLSTDVDILFCIWSVLWRESTKAFCTFQEKQLDPWYLFNRLVSLFLLFLSHFFSVNTKTFIAFPPSELIWQCCFKLQCECPKYSSSKYLSSCHFTAAMLTKYKAKISTQDLFLTC